MYGRDYSGKPSAAKVHRPYLYNPCSPAECQAAESSEKTARHDGHWKKNMRNHGPPRTVTAFHRAAEGLQQLYQPLLCSKDSPPLHTKAHRVTANSLTTFSAPHPDVTSQPHLPGLNTARWGPKESCLKGSSASTWGLPHHMTRHARLFSNDIPQVS